MIVALIITVGVLLAACSGDSKQETPNETNTCLALTPTAFPPSSPIPTAVPPLVTSTPRPSVIGGGATAKPASKSACPADTDAQLNTFASNASAEIKRKTGKTISPSKIKADILETIAAVDPNRTRSCKEQFDLYVLSETV